ncbi:MAG: hypothetical protein O9342_03990 [Beijerinckiaceae bacterium]|nr:hypothetical protein [Beijerinckiaceae bacterium]
MNPEQKTREENIARGKALLAPFGVLLDNLWVAVLFVVLLAFDPIRTAGGYLIGYLRRKTGTLTSIYALLAAILVLSLVSEAVFAAFAGVLEINIKGFLVGTLLSFLWAKWASDGYLLPLTSESRI